MIKLPKVRRISFGSSTLLMLGMGLSLAGALAGAPPAHAASIYDDLIKPTSSLRLIDSDHNYDIDISTTYASIINEKCTAGYYDSFQNAVTDPTGTQSWAIMATHYDNGSLISETVEIIWTETDTTKAVTTWSNPGGADVKQADVHGSKRVSLGVNSVGAITCSSESGSLTSHIGFQANYVPNPPYEFRLFLSTYDPNYPVGYDGAAIPDTWTPPSDYVPNWTGTVTNFNGQFSDSNFFTFDNPGELCEDDLVPVLHWELWSDTGMLTSGTQSASSQINYSFPRVNETRNYWLIGLYDCGTVGPVFSDTARWDFAVDQYGSLVNDIFETCLKDEFPFVDLPGCVENIFHFVNLLSFGTVTIGAGWSASTECYNLVIVDDWIHADNPTICPQFSSTVRNIVTPFVTFLLGLLTIAFLARSTGKQL